MRNILLLVCSILLGSGDNLVSAQNIDADFFENRVRPVLSGHCLNCHGSKKQEAKLRLDSREAMLKGGESGPAIDEQDPANSYLLQVLNYSPDDIQMPPDGKLKADDIESIRRWVMAGAPWPKSQDGSVIPADLTTDEGIAYAQKTHWAFQPIRKPKIPVSIDAKKDLSPIDRFVNRQLNATGLTMADRVSPRKLLRRVYFDLLGLPPTFEQVKQFEVDPSPWAFANVVDELLARPEYGERWGRHWLDIARYADTRGYLTAGKDTKYHHGFTYRDYVIRSFNNDKPYDQFILEQLAADQLELADRNDQAAMGFLTTGRRFINNIHDITDDRIDVVTRGLLGMTLQCARCHDHKFDPLTAKDYYALYGVFRSSDEPSEDQLPIIGNEDVAKKWQAYYDSVVVPLENQRREALEARKKAKGEERERLTRLERDLGNKITAAKKKEPPKPARAMIMVDSRPFRPYVFNRGKAHDRGENVERQFLQVVGYAADEQPFQNGSGRLELAKAIVDERNPLTARVLANRIWQHHFGSGIVLTPSDFGYRGEKPSHPELLDYLAASLIESDWSIKKLHRMILLSHVYQQDSKALKPELANQIDAENRLLSHQNLRRLEWEPLRDSLLSVSDQLDDAMEGPSVDVFRTPFSTRRTVYAFVDRQTVPETLRNFDFANPDATTAERPGTTVPQQSLFMMNSPFVAEQVRKLTSRILQQHQSNPDRIRALFQIVFQREPTAEETNVAKLFLSQDVADTVHKKWQILVQSVIQSNEFIFVE